MEKFYCPNCDKIFEAKGKKREWQDSVYGRCWKRIAKCPVCGRECDEYWPRTFSKKKESMPPTYGCGNCGL